MCCLVNYRGCSGRRADFLFVAYLNGGRHPEIAQAARRQALSSADEDAFDSSDSEDNASTIIKVHPETPTL